MDAQYEKDQRRLEARREAAAARNASILGRLHKDPEQKERERAQAAEEMRQHMQRLERANMEKQETVKKETDATLEKLTEEIDGDAAKERKRREWSQRMMKQNRELCEYRYNQRKLQEEQEKEVDRQRLAQGFMNRFGTSLQ